MPYKSRFEYALNPIQSWMDHERRRLRRRKMLKNLGAVAAIVLLIAAMLFLAHVSGRI